jgi:penicillin amidase
LKKSAQKTLAVVVRSATAVTPCQEPAVTTTHHTVPGLQQPAEIVVDRWGIPHIRAATRHDLFFVQGFNAARDRLWQLDIWRKRGLGLLAADFGPGFVAQDRAARLFLYRGDMDAEWAAYGTGEARSITEAFVAGLNAFIAATEANPALLPPEFAAMGNKPARWAADDVVRIRSHALVRNVLSEVARAQVMARADARTDLARKSIEPPWTTILPEGLDLASIPAAVLDVFKLATVAIDFSPERLAATLAEAERWTGVTELGDVYLQGSNNWAVAPGRTGTGRPILASDPHRAHALPSLRYIVHLDGPGLNAIGCGEPSAPGISFGHNGTSAFCLTIFPMDQEDLYVYETRGHEPDLYRYADGWERMTTLTETIAVKGCPDQQVTLRFTRHGPVVHQSAVAAYAIRSLWFEPGASAYTTSLAVMQATNLAEYEAALVQWSAPSVNHVYADTAGNIAWFAAGRVPVRPNWDGLLPVPGDGRYEWQGFHPRSDLPSAVNPEKGFVATANEMNLPADYRIDEHRIGFEWAEHSRTNRIHEVLATQDRHSLEHSMALQTDDLSLPARRLAPLLAALPHEGEAAPALAVFRDWDFRLARTSAPALLHELWWTKHLKPALLDRIAPDPVVRKLLIPGDHETLLGLLEAPDERLPDRDEMLLLTLADAYADAVTRFGPDPALWQWGRLHHGYFEHPLSPVTQSAADVGPFAKGGSGSCVMNAGYRATDFRVTHGASFRMVLDVGAWDNSRAINAPGQSGDPRSPHYADLAPLWAAGDYVPLLYSRAAVDEAASQRIRLTPGD